MIFKRKPVPDAITVGPAVVPLMDQATMVRAMQDNPGGVPGMALLQYSDDTFELVAGSFSVIVEDSGIVGYWIGDHLVAVLGRNGTPEPVPTLQSLRLQYVYPLDTLVTERLMAAS